jgi:hypothetical protein
MAAGLGFKDFVTGEVLTAADVDGYLMQGVWVFASAAARDAAVTSPQEGNFAYLKDTNVTTYYTGSAWANLDTTGMTNPMTTTGDTIYSSSGSTPARLGIGSTGQVLTVASGVPSWATPAGASLTVGNTYTAAEESTSSTSYTTLTTGTAVTVTTGSKALVIWGAFIRYQPGAITFDVSGATTDTGGDSRALMLTQTAYQQASRHFVITGLTAGSNTFTLKFRSPDGGSVSFDRRNITVIDLGS